MTKKYEINNQSIDIWTNQKGYPCVTINHDGKDRAFLLHRPGLPHYELLTA